MTLSRGEMNRAKREAEKIKPGDADGKNHKILRDGETHQVRLDHNIRVQYIVEDGEVKILDIFKKVGGPR